MTRRHPRLVLALLLVACAPSGEKARPQFDELVGRGKMVAARALVEKTLKAHPRDVPALGMDVELRARERRLGEATDQYSRIVELTGKQDTALLLEIYLAAIRDSSFWVVRSALSAAGDLSLDTAFPLVVGARWDYEEVVRAAAYSALGRFRREETAERLFDGYMDGDPAVRAAALDAAARLGDTTSRVMSTLVSLDPNQYVIWHYMMMQAELGEVGFARRVDKYLTEYIPGLSTEAALSRARRGDRSFLPLAARGLKSSLPHERQIAVRGLGELRAAEYLSDFRAAAGDTNAPVRAAAAYSLGATGDTGAVATLLELSRDSDAWVRQPATLALGRVGGAPAESRLAELLADDQSCVRVAAVAALLHLERTGRH